MQKESLLFFMFEPFPPISSHSLPAPNISLVFESISPIVYRKKEKLVDK